MPPLYQWLNAGSRCEFCLFFHLEKRLEYGVAVAVVGIGISVMSGR